MHPNSFNLFKEHALPHFRPGMLVLEMGPDREDVDAEMSLRKLTLEAGTWYTCASLENEDRCAVAMCGEYKINRRDRTFDAVFSANVIEHVRQPWEWLKELTRVTLHGGLVVTICPNSWPFHPGGSVDCWRIWPDGFRALFDWCGLEEVMCRTREEGGVIDTIAVGRKP